MSPLAWLSVIFPGMFLVFHPLAKKLGLMELVASIVFFSVSTWISLYTLLKFIPLQLTQLLTYAPVFCAVAWVVVCFTQKIQVQLKRVDVVIFPLLLLPFFLLGKIMDQQIVPAGSDMATHSYIARVISYYNGFPVTMQPIVPVDHFGFEPVGMPFLISVTSSLMSIPVHTSALLWSIATYPLLIISAYVFLRQFFSQIPSLVASYAVFFINQHIPGYLTFGAHPTTLSVAFLFMGIAWVASHWKHNHQLTPSSGVILGFFLSASFAIHQIPLVTALYFFLPCILLWIIRQRREQTSRLTLLATLFVLTLCTTSFITSIQPLSQDTIQYLKDWQRDHKYIALPGTPLSYLFEVPYYLKKQTGDGWWLLFVPGLLLGFTLKNKHRQAFTVFFIGLLIYFVIILNSRYWFLPLSSVLYPDRVTTVSTVLCVYFAAVTIHVPLEWLKRMRNRSQSALQKITLYTLATIVCIYTSMSYFKMGQHVYRYILADSALLSSVTPNDYEAMRWIEENTPQMAVINNAYSDSGVWIPAIAGRRVHYNDASPHTFDALGAGISRLVETHAFVGEKNVYSESFAGHHEQLSREGYVLVFQRGESKVYERDFSIKVGQ